MRRRLGIGALVCLLALAGCGKKQSASLHISPELERLVPSDTVVVLGMELAALRTTATYQKLMDRVPLPQLDEFEKQTGLDPRKDLSELLLCSNGKGVLVLVRGKFRLSDLEARLKSRGAKESSYKGHRMFDDDRGAIAFWDDSTAAVGEPAEVRALLDRGTGGALPADLRALLRGLPADDQIYGALTGGIQQLNLPLPRQGDVGSMLQNLQSVNSAALGLNLSHGIEALAELNCGTERDAKFIHDILRGLIGFGRLNTPDNQPEMLKLYDAIQVTQQQQQTKVTAAIPQDLTDRFLDRWLKK